MSRLAVQLGVDDFDTYRTQLLAAQKLAVDTTRVINGQGKNVTFGNFSNPKDFSSLPQKTNQVQRQLAADFKAIQKDMTGYLKGEERKRELDAKSAAKARVAEERAVAAEIAAINKQTSANKRITDRTIEMSAKAVADFEIKEAKRSANGLIAEFQRAELERRDNRLSPQVLAMRAAGLSGPSAGEQKYGRINLARQGADVFTQLGSGQGLGIVAIQQGPQIIEAMAQSGLKLSASLATMGPLIGIGAAAGLVAYKITGDIRAEAEKRLAVEEKIQGVLNKQILVSKEYFDVLQKGRQDAVDKQGLSDFENGLGNNLADLESRRKTFELLLAGPSLRIVKGADKNGKPIFDEGARKQSDVLLQQIQLIDQQILKVKELGSEKAKTASADRLNDQIFEINKKAQADARAAFERDVNGAIDKIKELEKSNLNALSSLSARANSDNPFVALFTGAKKDLDELKEGIRGLPAELQAAAIQSQQAINANGLFKLRLDNSLDVLDLRDRAAAFRDDTSQRKAFSEDGFARETAEAERRIAAGGVNASAIRDYLARRQSVLNSRFKTPQQLQQDRLDRQFAVIDAAGAATEAQRAAADRKAISLAGNDPTALRSDQRERVASALERDADRKVQLELDGVQTAKDQLKAQQAIAKNTEALVKLAGKNGSKVLELIFKDDTGDGFDVKTPTPSDVSDNYQFEGFGLAGGSNR